MWSEAIKGQDIAVKMLKKAMQQQRLAQSYLFYGPEGVGKFHTARQLALAIQCDQGFSIGCGICPACRKILSGNHPDRQVIEPEGSSNTIRVEQIRDLRRLMSLRPNEGRRRIVVFDAADRMNEIAANALLKTLEEPPEESLLILVTSRPSALLATISSRCYPLRFSKLTNVILNDVLNQNIPGAREWQESKKIAVLNLANGSWGQLLRLQEDDQENTVEKRLQHIAWYIEEPNWTMLQRLSFAEKRNSEWKERDDWQDLWVQWESLTRDRIALARGVEAEHLLNIDVAVSLQQMPPCSEAKLWHRLSQLREALTQLSSYTSPRLVAEGLLIKW